MMNEINFFVSNFMFHSSALVFKCWAPWGSKSGFPRNLEEVWDLQPQNPSLVHPSLLHHHQTLASTPSPRFFIQGVADHHPPVQPSSSQLPLLQRPPASRFRSIVSTTEQVQRRVKSVSRSPKLLHPTIFIKSSGQCLSLSFWFFFCSSSSRSWVREGGQPCHRTTIRGSIAKIPHLQGSYNLLESVLQLKQWEISQSGIKPSLLSSSVSWKRSKP